MDIIEEWRAVPGYEGLYEVSNLGGVRSLDRVAYRKNGTPLKFKAALKKPSRHGEGYQQTTVTKDGKTTQMLVHVMVARAFIPNPYKLPQVNHKDGDRWNPVSSNLEWVTPQGNIVHARNSGRLHGYTNRNRRFKLDPQRVRAIRMASADGESQERIGARFGVSRRCVGMVVNYKRWNPEFEDKAIP